MDRDQVIARSAIEALRSGVPSRYAVAELGTTQKAIEEGFAQSLDQIRTCQPVQPLVLTAGFGTGKTHLFQYLRTLAEREGFVTSYVVVSPEMPIGNPQVVLKAIAENARAPNREGRALRALTTDLRASTSPAYAEVRKWAKDADIHDRFRALLLLYEEVVGDDEFSYQILGDLEGKPLAVGDIRKRLKDVGQRGAYDLTGHNLRLHAHDRLRVLGQLFRALTKRGLVVLFDEVERVDRFTTNQRLASYYELGWWRGVAHEAGSGVLPIFATTNELIDHRVREDRRSAITSHEDRARSQSDGMDILDSAIRLETPTREECEVIRFRVKSIYKRAYGREVPMRDGERSDVKTTIRSEIRRWIAEWDLARYYPDEELEVVKEDITFDPQEIDDAVMRTGDEDNDA